MTTGPILQFNILACLIHVNWLSRLLFRYLYPLYLIPLVFRSAGMADLILVNSKFTASTFANTFRHLDAGGIQPAVLYPAVNVDQFEEPKSSK